MPVCAHPDPTTCPCPDPYCFWCKGPANHESDDHPFLDINLSAAPGD